VKRLCREQRQLLYTSVIVECERKHGHQKKHRASWREGIGGKFVDIVVKW